MKYIIDRYGTEVDTEVCTEDTFIARVPVTLSPTFFGQVFQFTGRIEIRGPKESKDKFIQMLQSNEKQKLWVNQGKYNLTPEELKIEEERIKDNYKELYKLQAPGKRNSMKETLQLSGFVL